MTKQGYTESQPDRARDGVHVTRYDESDMGTEIRVEVTLGGRTAELVVTDGASDGISLWELGKDSANPYHGGRKLYEVRR